MIQVSDHMIDQLTDQKMCRHLMSDQSLQEIYNISVILSKISSTLIDAVYFNKRFASNSYTNITQQIVPHMNFM